MIPTYSQLVAARTDAPKSFTFHLSDSASFTVRAVLRDGEPWFVAADVCAALELDHTALRRLDDDEKGRDSIPTLGGEQSVGIVNESGLYSLVLGSRKPEAKQFKRWVTSEVLPAIRKTGQYVAPKPAAGPELLPVDLHAQTTALKAILADDDLKRLAPLVWQEICDGAQNAMRRAMGAPLALPAPDAPKLLDVVEIAKAAGIELPTNLRGAAGKYVKARVTGVETERIISGSIRKSSAYADHAAVADALREYLGKRAA
jgi:prophage antirepressor-like protein